MGADGESPLSPRFVGFQVTEVSGVLRPITPSPKTALDETSSLICIADQEFPQNSHLSIGFCCMKSVQFDGYSSRVQRHIGDE